MLVWRSLLPTKRRYRPRLVVAFWFRMAVWCFFVLCGAPRKLVVLCGWVGSRVLGGTGSQLRRTVLQASKHQKNLSINFSSPPKSKNPNQSSAHKRQPKSKLEHLAWYGPCCCGHCGLIAAGTAPRVPGWLEGSACSFCGCINLRITHNKGAKSGSSDIGLWIYKVYALYGLHPSKRRLPSFGQKAA